MMLMYREPGPDEIRTDKTGKGEVSKRTNVTFRAKAPHVNFPKNKTFFFF